MESSVDIIAIVPKEARFKVWEHLMRRGRDHYQDLIIVFTRDEITGKDYSKETMGALPGARFFNSPEVVGDWRNVATNYGIDKSSAENILFLEQDFFLASLDCISKNLPKTLAVKIDGRIHPCFLRVSRENIEKTNRDFSAYPDEDIDHFGKFTNQLKNVTFLKEPYYHMAGLTHNMRLEAQGKKIIYKPDEYKMYTMISGVI